MKKTPLVFLISSAVIILDVITKRLILANVKPSDAIDILPFLRIVLVKNTGAAFGMFASLGNTFFIVVTLLAIFFIILYLSKIPKGLEQLALSLILGGAIGNFIDRLTVGEVTDFIDFYIGTWHWPAFNVADSALTVGIMIFIFANLFCKCKDDEAHSEGSAK
jgi:signal peptidase II